MSTSIQSNVPASDIELSTNQPFRFTVNGVGFEIPPLSLDQYMMLEKEIHQSIYAILFHKNLCTKRALKTLITDDMKGIVRARSLVSIIAGLILKNQSRWKLFQDHGIVSLQRFLGKNISLDETINVASHFMRYCAEKKNELSQILQEGIGNHTTEKPTSSLSIAEDW